MKVLFFPKRATAIFMVLLLAICLTATAVRLTAPAAYANDVWGIVGDDGSINTDSDVINSDANDSQKTVISQYKTIATTITGILTITMIIFMIIQITKLGAAGDNEVARKKAIMGILTTGIATALFGGLTIVVGFFWNILMSTGGED